MVERVGPIVHVGVVAVEDHLRGGERRCGRLTVEILPIRHWLHVGRGHPGHRLPRQDSGRLEIRHPAFGILQVGRHRRVAPRQRAPRKVADIRCLHHPASAQLPLDTQIPAHTVRRLQGVVDPVGDVSAPNDNVLIVPSRNVLLTGSVLRGGFRNISHDAARPRPAGRIEESKEGADHATPSRRGNRTKRAACSPAVKLRRLKGKGDTALVHALRGRQSNRKLDERTKRKALEILGRDVYRGFGLRQVRPDPHDVQLPKRSTDLRRRQGVAFVAR